MVWALIGGTGTTKKRSELIIMERDPESKCNSYSSYSYLKTLDIGLLPIYNSELFIQDNAPIYTARIVRTYFDNNRVHCLVGWPLYSLDMNPIEHLWPRLKESIYKLAPDINSITNKDWQVDRLIEVLPMAWSQIPLKTVEGCLKSMRSRLQAVIDADGWHTKY